MDLIVLFEENFSILIGIFVALIIMGTTTLYDNHKSKGGASFDLSEFKLLSDLSPKITAIGSEFLKQSSEFCKKLSSLIKKILVLILIICKKLSSLIKKILVLILIKAEPILKKSGIIPKKSGSSQKKSGSNQKKSGLIQSDSVNNYLKQVEAMLLKAKDAGQKLFVSLNGKISSLSSSSPRKKTDNKEKFVPLSDAQKEELEFDVAGKVNNLDKVVESKKDELDFDDDLLTKMSSSSSIAASSPELKPVDPPIGEISSDMDMSFDDDFKMDEGEFAIKVDGLDDESEPENNFAFEENVQEIKFGDEKDNLLDSLKKEIVVKQESKINFMDSLQGENLDLQLMKSDLEGVLKDLKKYRQLYSKS